MSALSFLVFLIVSTTLFGGAPPAEAADGYAGSEKCEECHKAIYAGYRQSGHPYKIQKIQDGLPPVYPVGTSSGVPRPPEGMDWKDISHVIGGYGWKARFMDKEGYILTGKAERQYNLKNETLGLKPHWGGYDAKKEPRKPYTCGTCHTTGWKKTGKDGPHQDDLPGIHGTWAEPGVTCESCHGPGAAHVTTPRKVKLSTKPNCGSCHIRGDVKTIDASKGMIRHHEQYEDLLASPHRKKGCMACHDPHVSSKYGQGGFKGQIDTCIKCHVDEEKEAPIAIKIAPEGHKACISCHMPFAGKSAVAIKIKYRDGVVPKGDIRTHIHRIDTDPSWSMFTDDGKYVRTDRKGRAYLTVDFTCLSCHTSKDKTWALDNAKRIHGDD
jgi:predicted CXXCH cytochrome family protein